jgi:hypothetical protein
MPIACPNCSASLPEKAAFCARCGRPTGASIAVRETPESLLRQMASLFQKHAVRPLVVKFVGPWSCPYEKPRAKIAAVQFKNRTWIFETSVAFVVKPILGKLLFHDGCWSDIRVFVFQESGFDDARTFAEAYRGQTGRNVELVKKFA